ncbi:HAMP domain-containing sensor histidine kinase [Legionella sp. km535]|uniref:sensor histidine kinase n=1 Tax=Legionella sp. km535 TaxID=2498107 RepID=UPI0013151313|nr:HAMP domain-containing sensor histidine kinase [Legionella sp. km535]
MTLKQYFLKFNKNVDEHAKKFAHPYITFAIFGIITYPLFYLVWMVAASGGYENLELRLVTVFLCVLLALKDYWPNNYKKFFSLFWYITLLYSLPFLFTFLLLKNDMSYSWSMNGITVLVLSILLLDLLSLFIILTLGICLGLIVFLITGGVLSLPPDYMTVIVTYCSVLLFGTIFSYRKDQLKEREKRIAAEAANQAKSEFISNMQHDLKTPFAGISAVAMMLYEMETDSDKKSLLQDLLKSSQQWEAVHHQIIAVLSIKEPQAVRKEWLSVSHELDQIKDMLSATIRVKALDFYIAEISNQEDKIKTDKLKFNLILSNLIGNAINFTEKGFVKIKVVNDGTTCTIQVIDTGIGIPEDKLDYIFEKFTKLSQSNKYQDFKGVGLGLYTSRLMANQLGGDIRVQSKLGEGSVFTLTLPLQEKSERQVPLPFQE